MQPILDVACGGKMFYFDKHDPRVLFCDIRRIKTTLCDGREFEVNPDIQADFTDLPFEDDSFQVVVFDPPTFDPRHKQKQIQRNLRLFIRNTDAYRLAIY